MKQLIHSLKKAIHVCNATCHTPFLVIAADPAAWPQPVLPVVLRVGGIRSGSIRVVAYYRQHPSHKLNGFEKS